MTSQELRECLFGVYAANLTLCFPEAKDTFLCPFCLRTFNKEAVQGDKPKVILAHCVPDALRGRLQTLACAECDNRAGRDIDMHLINRLETSSFLRGESPDSRRVWFHSSRHRARADYRIIKGDGGKFEHEFKLDGKHSPPGQCEGIKEAMAGGEARKHRVRVTQRGQMAFSMRLSRVALLRAGYLLAFRQFGYSYILNPNLNRLREQFRRPREAIIPGRPVVQLSPDTFAENTICLTTAPKEALAFLAVLRCRTDGGSVSVHGVVLPGLGDGGDSVYEAIRADQEQHDAVSLTYKDLAPVMVQLDDPESVSRPYDIWEQYLPEQV
jgi:hypothetical protein